MGNPWEPMGPRGTHGEALGTRDDPMGIPWDTWDIRRAMWAHEVPIETQGECLFCFKSLRRRCGWPSARCAAAARFRCASKLNICASKLAHLMVKLAEPDSTCWSNCLLCVFTSMSPFDEETARCMIDTQKWITVGGCVLQMSRERL